MGSKDKQPLYDIQKSLKLMSEYRWLSDAYVSDFFTKELWKKVNVEWWKTLCLLDPEELASLLSTETWKSRCVWPLSLLAYRSSIQTLCLRNISENVVKISEKVASDCSGFKNKVNGYDKGRPYDQLELCFQRHVKPKKQHEILHMAKVVSEVCQHCNSQQVLDVGAGQGHLTRLLAFRYGLNATTIEAAGCHSPKAEKFDREVKSDILKGRIVSKKQQKNSLGQSNQGTFLTNREPNHVTATIQPDISVEDFLSHVTECLEEKKKNQNDQDKGILTENESSWQLQDYNNKVHVNLNTSDKDSDCSICELKFVKFLDINEAAPDAISNQFHIPRDNIENLIDNDLEIPKRTVAKNTSCKCVKCTKIQAKYECTSELKNQVVHCNCKTEGSEVSNSKDIAAECDRKFLRTDSDTHSNDLDTHSYESYSHIDRDNENFNLKRKKDRSACFIMTGLHACGDLTSTMLRMFVKCDQLTGLASVGCCYMKLTTSASSSDKDLGYPMSSSVKSLPDHHLSYEALEMACHFIDAYHKRLLDSSTNLHSHCYRAALQEIIREKDPDFTHGCVKVTIKNTEHMNFKQYAEKALKRLGLDTTLSTSQIENAEERLKDWKKVVAFYTLRLSLAPVLETIVLQDRVIYLQENGIRSELKPIFDPLLSPRNFVLLAMK